MMSQRLRVRACSAIQALAIGQRPMHSDTPSPKKRIDSFKRGRKPKAYESCFRSVTTRNIERARVFLCVPQTLRRA
jgi:hypothetical protein